MKIKMLFDKVFLKFLIVGVINTIVGYAIMFVLFNALHMNDLFAAGCGYFLSSILSFYLNKHFTFTVKHWSVFMIIAFIVTIVVSYFLPFWFAEYIVEIWLKNSTETVRGNVVLIAGTCLASAVSYFGQRFVVFRKKSEE